MRVEKLSWQDGDVAVIQVDPSENPPIKVDGRCWIRSGPSRSQATSEEERRLTEKRRCGNLPYDMQGVLCASVENDIDMRKFDEYLPNAISKEVLEENSRHQEDQLRALRLITRNGLPTTTAILTLGKDSRYWFPGAYIQYVRYDGNEMTDPVSNNKEITGTLFDQLQTLGDLIKINMATKMDRSGTKHIEQPDYPLIALREMAHNAVIHRNYENSHAPIRLLWFKEWIEIDSPGSLYGRVTKDNIEKETDYRNPTIAEAMKNMGYMEKFGSGIRLARKELADNGNPELEFEITETRVHVTIRKAI